MLDVETALLDWLPARPELNGYTFGTRRPVDLVARLLFVLLTRTGGAASLPTWRVGPVLDRAGIAVQVPDPDGPAHVHRCSSIVDGCAVVPRYPGAGEPLGEMGGGGMVKDLRCQA